MTVFLGDDDDCDMKCLESESCVMMIKKPFYNLKPGGETWDGEQCLMFNKMVFLPDGENLPRTRVFVKHDLCTGNGFIQWFNDIGKTQTI